MPKSFFWTLALVSSLVSSVTFACLHFPLSFQDKMTEGKQEIFLFRDGKQAHMVLRTQLEAKKFPREVAWILPFPSVPSKYEQLDGPFFEELVRAVPQSSNRGLKKGDILESGADGSESFGGIKVHDLVDVGEYQIQAIEILKDDSAKELNDWLNKNQFNPMPAELQKPYLKKGAAFLAIRMKMSHPGEGELRSKTLHVVYQAGQLSMPIRFTHAERTFDLDVYVFTPGEQRKDLDSFYLSRISAAPYKNEKLLPFVDPIVGDQKGFFTLYSGRDLNSKDKRLSKLKADPVFD